MSIGQGSISVQQKAPVIPTPPPPGPPFALTSADNGTSIDPVSRRIVLGQSIGEAGDPAQLLSNREIPMNTFSFALNPVGSRKFFIDPLNKFYGFGEIDGSNNGMVCDILDNNFIFEVFSNNAGYLELNGFAKTYQMGDVYSAEAGMLVMLDNTNGLAQLGDINNVANNFVFEIDDPGQRGRFFSAINFANLLDLDWINRKYRIGEFDNANEYVLEIDKTNDLAKIKLNDGIFLLLDRGTGIHQLGDVSGGANSSEVKILDVSKQIELRAGGNVNLLLDDNVQNYVFGDVANVFGAVSLQLAGGKVLSRNTTEMMGSLSGFGNNAAANVGTLNNSPAAGDPTKWIPIDDNGVIRNIPAW